MTNVLLKQSIPSLGRFILLSLLVHLAIIAISLIIAKLTFEPKTKIQFVTASVVQLGIKANKLPVKKIKNLNGSKSVPKKVTKKTKVEKKIKAKPKRTKKKSNRKRAVKKDNSDYLEALASIDGIEGEQTRIQTGSENGSAAGDLSSNKINKLQNYGQLLQQKIRQNYRLTNQNLGINLVAVVRIWINNNGKITQIKLVKNSKNILFDRQLLAAVKRSSPLPVPPPSLNSLLKQGIDIEFRP